MKLYQQFDLNIKALKTDKISNIAGKINEMPVLVERLVRDLLDEGYIVVESKARHMGMPRDITIVKDFTGPFVSRFSAKIREDFDIVSKKLGVEKLFE